MSQHYGELERTAHSLGLKRSMGLRLMDFSTLSNKEMEKIMLATRERMKTVRRKIDKKLAVSRKNLGVKRRKYSMPSFIPDKEQQGQIVEVIARHGGSLKSQSSILNELGKCGLPMDVKALRRFFNKKQEMVANRRKELYQEYNPNLPIQFRNYRLERLQEIVEDEKLAVKDRIGALREARQEMTDREKKYQDDKILDALPVDVQARLLSRCDKIIDMEMKQIESGRNIYAKSVDSGTGDDALAGTSDEGQPAAEVLREPGQSVGVLP